MGALLDAVRHGLGGLLRFSGRDPRRRFWTYAGAAVGAVMLGIGGAMSWAFQGPASWPSGQMSVFTALTIGPILSVILLAAATTRRLHDRGRSGGWGLPAATSLVIAAVLPPCFVIAAGSEDGPMMWTVARLLIVNSLFFLASLTLLIVLLAGAGQARENRFGPPAP
jgi:uncharacterized membrane protein YhaH (DUF805 family)